MTEVVEEDENLNFALEQAATMKDAGNEHFKAGEWADAVKQYTNAIMLDPTNHVFYSNRCASYMKLMEKSKALKDGQKCVELKPDWLKGYIRLAGAQHLLTRFADAMETCQKGLDIDPYNEALIAESKACGRLKVEQDKQKEIQRQKDQKLKELRQAAIEREKAEEEKKAKEEAEAKRLEEGVEEGGDDLLADFFSEVKDIADSENVVVKTDVAVKKAQDLGDSKSQIDFLLQDNHKFKNLNPFYVLQLDKDDHDEEIKQRYRKLSSMVHPDKNVDNLDRARDAFEYVKKAYEVLSSDNQKMRAIMLIENAEKDVKKWRVKMLKKGMPPEKLGDEQFEIKKMIAKRFAESEQKRKKADTLRAAHHAREAHKESEAKEKKAENKKHNEKHNKEENREKRVGSWRNFDRHGKKVKIQHKGWEAETRDEQKNQKFSGVDKDYKKKWK